MPESDAQERTPWPVGGPLRDMFHHDFAAMLRATRIEDGASTSTVVGFGLEGPLDIEWQSVEEFVASGGRCPPSEPQATDDTGPHDLRADDCWRCDARCSATDVGLCGPCLADLRAGRVTPMQPEITWVTASVCNGFGDEVVSFVHATHDGPCVFVDHQCSCGRLDVGIVRASDDDEVPWFEHTDVPPTMWPTVWLTIAVGFLADRVAAVVRWVRR